jgi:hypothetical protein
MNLERHFHYAANSTFPRRDKYGDPDGNSRQLVPMHG